MKLLILKKNKQLLTVIHPLYITIIEEIKILNSNFAEVSVEDIRLGILLLNENYQLAEVSNTWSSLEPQHVI